MARAEVTVHMRVEVDRAATALAGILAVWNDADPDGYRRLGTGSVFPELAAAIERAVTAMDGAKVQAAVVELAKPVCTCHQVETTTIDSAEPTYTRGEPDPDCPVHPDDCCPGCRHPWHHHRAAGTYASGRQYPAGCGWCFGCDCGPPPATGAGR